MNMRLLGLNADERRKEKRAMDEDFRSPRQSSLEQINALMTYL